MFQSAHEQSSATATRADLIVLQVPAHHFLVEATGKHVRVSGANHYTHNLLDVPHECEFKRSSCCVPDFHCTISRSCDEPLVSRLKINWSYPSIHREALLTYFPLFRTIAVKRPRQAKT